MRTHSRPPAIATEVRGWYGKLSGTLLLAGATILMGIVTAEALYPAPYSTRRSGCRAGRATSSVLGGTASSSRRTNCCHARSS